MLEWTRVGRGMFIGGKDRYGRLWYLAGERGCWHLSWGRVGDGQGAHLFAVYTTQQEAKDAAEEAAKREVLDDGE